MILFLAVPALVLAAIPDTGFVEVCKSASGPGVTGSFIFDVGGQSVTVPVGACSPALEVPVGTVTIVEQAQAGMVVTDVSSAPAGRTIRRDLAQRSITVGVAAGDLSTQTVVTFTNAFETGQLKVCKVAGSGVATGTNFSFMAEDQAFTVPAGPAPGGFCRVAGHYPAGTPVTVTELASPGTRVSAITVTPSARTRTAADLADRSIGVTIGTGVTEVSFTNAAATASTTTSTTSTTTPVAPTTSTTVPVSPTTSTTVPVSPTTSTSLPDTGVSPTTTPVAPTTSTTVPVSPTTSTSLPDTGVSPTTSTSLPDTGVSPTTTPVAPTTSTTVPVSPTTSTSLPDTGVSPTTAPVSPTTTTTTAPGGGGGPAPSTTRPAGPGSSGSGPSNARPVRAAQLPRTGLPNAELALFAAFLVLVGVALVRKADGRPATPAAASGVYPVPTADADLERTLADPPFLAALDLPRDTPLERRPKNPRSPRRTPRLGGLLQARPVPVPGRRRALHVSFFPG